MGSNQSGRLVGIKQQKRTRARGGAAKESSADAKTFEPCVFPEYLRIEEYSDGHDKRFSKVLARGGGGPPTFSFCRHALLPRCAALLSIAQTADRTVLPIMQPPFTGRSAIPSREFGRAPANSPRT